MCKQNSTGTRYDELTTSGSVIRARHRPRGRRAGRKVRRMIPVIFNVFPIESKRPHIIYRTPVRTVIHIATSTKQDNNRLTIEKNIKQQHLPNFLVTNAQSLINKRDEFHLLMNKESVNVGIITESWFSTTHHQDQLDIPGYALFSKCREDRRGGGVAIYSKDGLNAQELKVAAPPELEILWIKLRGTRLPRGLSQIVVCGIYIVTDSPHQQLLKEHLINTIDEIRTRSPDTGFCIAGDFNRMVIGDILKGNDFRQIVKFNTRNNAVLDLIITNMDDTFYTAPSALAPIGMSDHVCVLWKPKIRPRLNSTKNIVVRPFYESRKCEFGRWLLTQDWLEVINSASTQDKMDALYNILNSAIDKYFPTKKVKIHCADRPWITNCIRDLIAKRQTAFARGDTTLFKKLRNKVKREIELAKTKYFSTRIRHLRHNDPRKWHSQIKDLTSSKMGRDLNINVTDISASDHIGIANAINSQFASINNDIPPLDYCILPAYLPCNSPAPQVKEWEVYNKLRKTNPHKSVGPDKIPPLILKEFALELSEPLTNILNCSFREGSLPTQWKSAVTVPIPKVHPPKIDKLRPISLTSAFAKVAEQFVCEWVVSDIQNKLDVRQYGNVKGASTSHYLVRLVHDMCAAAEEAHNIGTVVLTDFTKAFDRIEHNTLINKIIDIGVRRSIVPWICSFLSCREQCVKYNNSLSSAITLKAGVPQGTKLGPIAFQIMINDAVKGAKTNALKYVDDLSVYENRKITQPGHLQHDLNEFHDWCKRNIMDLNPAKCQALQICFSKRNIPENKIYIGGNELAFVTHAKILGVTLQNNLKWDKHIGDIVLKANRKLFILRSLKKFGFNPDELCSVYCGYIRPLLEYADVVWHPGLTKSLSNSIESVQRRACRTILGRDFSSYDKALKVCNISSLTDRRIAHSLKFAKGISQTVHSADLLPVTRFESHGRLLRNSNNISQLPSRTARFSNSPIPYFIRLLNA
ncbi:uncharacterized protein [Antedon mediterranea]|uniref:uncharacterized protein n=1 Tax=Antedon mediterranea TaxID=105859 RepID=UPI003AF6EDA3